MRYSIRNKDYSFFATRLSGGDAGSFLMDGGGAGGSGKAPMHLPEGPLTLYLANWFIVHRGGAGERKAR